MDLIRPMLTDRAQDQADVRKVQLMIEKALQNFSNGRANIETWISPKQFNEAARDIQKASRAFRLTLSDLGAPPVGHEVFSRTSQLTSRRFPLRILKDLIYFEEVLAHAIALEPSGGPKLDYPGHLLAYDLIHPFRKLTGAEPVGRVRTRSRDEWYKGNSFATFVHEIAEAHLVRLTEIKKVALPNISTNELRTYLNVYRLNNGGAAVSWAVAWFDDLARLSAKTSGI